MPKPLTRIEGLKGVRDLIKYVCESHIGVSQFKSGLNLLDDTTESLYPLAFLESDFTSRTQGSEEIYNIGLNIGDLIQKDATEDQIIDGMSKTEQILSEIHFQLSKVTGSIRVGEISKASFRDYDSDNLVVTRGEFTITVARYTARL